jgi:hypothetical protein
MINDNKPAWAQQEDALLIERVDAEVARVLQVGIWGDQPGIWRTKTQLTIDPNTHLLARRSFTIWDPTPSRNLDFTWVPDYTPGSGDIVSGRGKLIWRNRNWPSYDTRSIVAIYRGNMENGRPFGRGAYTEVDGVSYEGDWVDGSMQGVGHLKLMNGDEYQGTFFAGRPHGQGHYIDAAGEVYQGSFVAGRREGRATTMLPSGMSYTSEWRNGLESPSSRYIRLAQFGTPFQPPGSNSDVRIRIFVNPIERRMFRSPDGPIEKDVTDKALGYVSSNTETRLEIRPDNDRLLGMWKGDSNIALAPDEEPTVGFLVNEISYGVFSYAKTLLPPVEVVVEVQNHERAPIQITGAYLDVANSVTDREPAIQISVGLADECALPTDAESGAYNPKFRFENFGWSSAGNAVLHYTFVNPASKATPLAFPETKMIGNLAQVSTVNFEPDLSAAGVNTRLLARQSTTSGFKCKFKGQPDTRTCLTQIGGVRLFGKLMDKINLSDLDTPRQGDSMPLLLTAVTGSLEYEWTDSAGRSQKRVSPFNETIRLGRVNSTLECGDGSTVTRPTQKPIELGVDRANYRVAVPFRQAVPAGRFSRFALPLTAARSSEHDFTVVLQLADMRAPRSRPINLLYYYPSRFVTSRK